MNAGNRAASFKVEKPHTVPEAVRALHGLLPRSQLDVIKRSRRTDLVRFHFNLGSYIRNLWVHRDGSPLVVRLRTEGVKVKDGDELSRLIIEALWHDLNDQPFDVTESEHFRSLLGRGEDVASLARTLMVND